MPAQIKAQRDWNENKVSHGGREEEQGEGEEKWENLRSEACVAHIGVSHSHTSLLFLFLLFVFHDGASLKNSRCSWQNDGGWLFPQRGMIQQRDSEVY